MEDFTLSSVGAKNGGVVHPFSQNARNFLITSKKEVK
jgi:hypothetical protein